MPLPLFADAKAPVHECPFLPSRLVRNASARLLLSSKLSLVHWCVLDARHVMYVQAPLYVHVPVRLSELSDNVKVHAKSYFT